jgi:hypothetical protein
MPDSDGSARCGTPRPGKEQLDLGEALAWLYCRPPILPRLHESPATDLTEMSVMSKSTDGADAQPEFDLAAKPTREIVTLAHLLILGTPPRDEDEITKGLECGTVSLLRQSLLNSRRFDNQVKRKAGGPFLFFIHVPKTAGGSLRLYFKTALGDGCRWYMKRQESSVYPIMRNDVKFNAEDHLAKYRMSGGHIPFSDVPKPLVDRYPVFLSVIRNPVDRVLSHYNFVRTQEKHPSHKRMRSVTIFEALQDERFLKQCESVQLRFLTGETDLDAAAKVMESHKFLIGKMEHLSAFMAALHQVLDLPIAPPESQQIHRSAPDYLAKIAAQPRYDEAIDILTKLNEDEFKFYNSFDKVWTNVRTRQRKVGAQSGNGRSIDA